MQMKFLCVVVILLLPDILWFMLMAIGHSSLVYSFSVVLHQPIVQSNNYCQHNIDYEVPPLLPSLLCNM